MKVWRKVVCVVVTFCILLFNLTYFVSSGANPVSAQEETATTEFLYTASGQRIAKLDGSGVHTYYLPGVEVIINGDDVTYRRYYAFNGSVAIKDNNGLSYTHSDQLGSTAIATDSNGTLIGNTSYYPFGTTRTSEGEIAGERKYTGQVSDEDLTGLYYYNARYYSPTQGRFTQADSVNDGQNKYAYVGNNPINETDPTGQCKDPPCIGEPIIVDDFDIDDFLDVESTPYIDYAYYQALEGNYGSLPPMGFTSPNEMFSYVHNYGLSAFRQRAENAKFNQNYWLLNGFVSDLTPYWEWKYQNLYEELERDYPMLTIEKVNVAETCGQYAGACYGWFTIFLPFNETRPLTNFALLSHESQHFLDEINGVTNSVDTEINAFFLENQSPFMSEFDNFFSRQFLYNFWLLRSWEVNDLTITYLYHGNTIDGEGFFSYEPLFIEPTNHYPSTKNLPREQ